MFRRKQKPTEHVFWSGSENAGLWKTLVSPNKNMPRIVHLNKKGIMYE